MTHKISTKRKDPASDRGLQKSMAGLIPILGSAFPSDGQDVLTNYGRVGRIPGGFDIFRFVNG